MKKEYSLTVLRGSIYLTFAGTIMVISSQTLEQFVRLYKSLGGNINLNENINLYAAYFYLLAGGGFMYHLKHRSKFDRVFKNLDLGIDNKIYPILKSKVKTKHSITYKFTLPAGLSVDDFQKHQEAIEQHIGKKINIEYINKGLFIIEEFRNNTQIFYDYEPTVIKGNVPVFAGYDRKGRLITFDLAEGTEPHLLIAGTTGCGKSTSLRSIITNLILTTNVHLYLIDLKHGAEFSVFRRSSHVKGFADTLKKAEEILKLINDEIEARYKKFAVCGLNDIKGYNKRHHSSSLPYILLVIDEMVDFTQRKDLMAELDVISAKARACGIHLILSTQRPDKDVINGKIKVNVTNVLGMKTKDGINSRIIIDREGLEKLNGKGHAILCRLGDDTELQTPYLTVDKAKELIKHTYIVKEEPKAIPSEKIEFDISDLEVFR